MKRLALIGSLITTTLLSAGIAEASTLSGTVVSVNNHRHTVEVRDARHHLHNLRYRGTTPKAHAKATFTVSHGYAVLVVRKVAQASASRASSRKIAPRPVNRIPSRTTTTTSTHTVSAPTTTTTTHTASAPTTTSSSTATTTHAPISTTSTTSTASPTQSTTSTATPTTTSSTSSTASSSSSTTSSSASTTSSSSTTTTSTSTTATGSVPSHVETWGYDDGCNGGVGASSALVQNWLSYAESSCGTSATKAQTDCNSGGVAVCQTLAYLDANKIYQQYSMPIAGAAQESWWLHAPGYSDSAHRLVANEANWGNSNLLDQSNPGVQNWVANYARSNFSSYDGLMMDDTGPDMSQQFYGTGYSSSQEVNSDSALLSSHEAMAGALTKSDGSHFLQVDNSLNANPWLKTPFGLLGHNDGVHGFVAEGQPMSNGTLTQWYGSLLDDLSYVDGQPNAFIALLSYDQNGSPTARRVQEATVLLGYSPGHVVDWADLEQSNNNLAVFPEEGIYPTQAVQSMGTPGGSGCLTGNGNLCSTGGHNDVQVAPGVYRREFRACSSHGTAIGPCAAIVNDTSSPVTVQSSWLTQSYGHQVAFSGGDVQSGGSLNLNSTPFTAGSTTVPADDATLLAN